MVSLRQIRSFVAVFEERSFTAAAEREGATQSGISQHIKQLESVLGTELFLRDGRTVTPTPTGRRYHRECVAVLRRLEAAQHDAAAGKPSGRVCVGLMPTFTRAVLAPALKALLAETRDVDVRVVEAYSAVLTEQVRRGELDFAIVPAFPGDAGLATRCILRDREMLVTARGRTGRHLEPVRLAAFGPIDIVLPGPQNRRSDNIETYLASHGVAVRSRLHLDAMMGTLEFVATSDWVAILPGVLMAGELDGSRYEIRPLTDPPLFADFVLIEAARRALPPAATRFAEILVEQSQQIVAGLPG
jgi:DNA-binding transcriptional LysR family regulator